jgi:SAM-dependent methyltransferase
MLIVNPVVIEPLTSQWLEIKPKIEEQFAKAKTAKEARPPPGTNSTRFHQGQRQREANARREARQLFDGFIARLRNFRVLDPAAEAFYAPADIRAGHVVADFGCGPGHTAMELARRVGSSGHVHALDVSAPFVERTRARAEAAGLADRITVHMLTTERLPFSGCYARPRHGAQHDHLVRDPVRTFQEFRRVLKPGGIAHVIEGDWSLTAVEPLGAEWRALVDAASWVWRAPEIGRRLYGIACAAGFSKVALEVMTKPDTDGRLLGMVKTVASYARDSGTLDVARIDAMLASLERGLAEGSYLIVAPQFLVTATT